eukprot:6819843-Alexandrium_andersonii.AAC.1
MARQFCRPCPPGRQGDQIRICRFTGRARSIPRAERGESGGVRARKKGLRTHAGRVGAARSKSVWPLTRAKSQGLRGLRIGGLRIGAC